MSRSTALTWFALVVLLLEQISPLTPSTAASSATAASIDRSALLREARPVATPVTMTARGHVQRFAGPQARHITWLRQPQPPLRPVSSAGHVFLRGRTQHRFSQLLPSVLSPHHPRAYSTSLPSRGRHLRKRAVPGQRNARDRFRRQPDPIAHRDAATLLRLGVTAIPLQRVKDGVYPGVVAGYGRDMVYVQEGARLFTLHLRASSHFIAAGRSVHVSRPPAGATVAVIVRAGVATTLVVIGSAVAGAHAIAAYAMPRPAIEPARDGMALISAVSMAGTDEVTNAGDSGPGSLRDTITTAGDGDTITFAPGLGTITLTGGELLIAKNLTITGSAGAPQTVSGGNQSRVFEIADGVHVTIANLTIVNGQAPSNTNGPGGDGGGVLNGGVLTLNNSTVSNNRGGSAIENGAAAGGAGGLANTGTLMLDNSVVSGNTGGISAQGGSGTLGDVAGAGGITNTGTLTLDNSTVAMNTGGAGGAGQTNAGGTAGQGGAGGIANGGALTATNSAITMNTGGAGGLGSVPTYYSYQPQHHGWNRRRGRDCQHRDRVNHTRQQRGHW